MSVEIRDLKLVDAVAEHGTLTRAGQALFLTQSALSHQLADLERRLGTPLFVRAARRMVLTPAGERLRESAREILSAVSRAVDEARSVGERRRAVLRFATECYTAYHWLPSVLRAYQHDFPTVEARIVAGATRRPLPALLKGQIDVAVVSSAPRDRRVQLTPLFEDEYVIVVAPDHPWAGRAFVRAEDFADQHVIIYNIPRADSTLVSEVLDPRGVTPRDLSRVELTEAILELVKAGIGVAMFARWAVAPQVRSGALSAVRIGEKGLHRTWSAAVLRQAEPPVHLTAFVDLLRRIAEPAALCCASGGAEAAA